jgi:hypothetical protein
MEAATPSSSEPGRGPGPDEKETQRYGPLELLRLEKEDGRALILYRRATEPEADEE